MKHYAPEEIIRRSIVVQIELLLLAVIQQRYARHDEVGDERSQRTSLSSIDKTRPTENVEIARPEHVLRIGYASLWLYEVVRHETSGSTHRYFNIIGDLQITVHSEEARKRTID